jgi:hypothetical protein
MDTKEFREAGHRMIDWIAEYLDSIEGRALYCGPHPFDPDVPRAEDWPRARQGQGLGYWCAPAAARVVPRRPAWPVAARNRRIWARETT